MMSERTQIVRADRRSIGLPAAAVALLVLVVLVGGAPAVAGRAAAGSFPGAPATQRYGEFGRCPLAPPDRYLARRSGCVTVRRGDVDGDGRTDLIVLYAHLDRRRFATGFTLEVIRASGGTLVARVPHPDLNATIIRVRELNARAGVEILVHETHVTTEDLAGVYTFTGRALTRARGFAYGGEDAGIRFGFSCHPPATIIQHQFDEQTPFAGVWHRTDTTYRWVGPRLVRGTSHTVLARPSARQVGVHC